MHLRHLEQVVEICREGSFGRAAVRLGVSQPSLSKSIARLETELGVELFERVGSGARPTAYGLFLAERAEDILGRVTTLTRDFTSYVKGDSRRLRIGVGAATRVRPLNAVIAETVKAFPALRIEVRQANAPTVIQGVSEGRFDVAFAYHGSAEPYGDLMRIRIFSDRFVLVCRPDHPARTCPPESIPEVLEYPIASTSIDPSLRARLGNLSEVQRDHLQAFQSDDYEMVKARVYSSDSIGLGPYFVFEEDLAAARLSELPLQVGAYECWMLTTQAQWRSPIIQAIARIAKEASPSYPSDVKARA